MEKQVGDENLKDQSQKKTKWTLQDIEENSIDQLIAQPIPAFKETLEKLLADNNEEIARLINLNEKIPRCLDRIDQNEQENAAIVVSVAQQNTSKVSYIFLSFDFCF
jgi:hypothetical protein